ncbi:phosphoadenosine phosphosulfate reductase [Ameyamaea chiangmaiensis NBRC 103196]|uniref:Adenosine 5'-phosphosulfate reductase n=1 Tax=Ameyamaea chiangmaiensis TaxID=442969 RepID=A0A850PA08_9PROT|nr:phosphoadenylyl-sulfate reductase [Ameyamaea chiangmaiensis]MBS4074870.1 phosphoadenylyl-sulfate reductase [Ameyamaea chiangmaiensis]NVN41387.1 phosphoadenylyl-sulfate reductase [Ameyamaea chiangmaiensis]GBQ63052.1 phosphoadenosine phosphosulfate reductase [Ameyamaea chiangmaiensis NBRC 103196]
MLDDIASVTTDLHAAGTDARRLMHAALTGPVRGRVALVSSFGAESALLLAMAAEVDPAVPVLFLETGQHFPETLVYRDDLASWLGLRDVRTIAPAPAAVAARDPEGQLWAFDADACCTLRKVEPLDDAIIPFDAWITGRKRGQALTRQALPTVETTSDGRLKINPLAAWSPKEIDAEMTRLGVPRHPLSARGYPSIGCAPCTRPVRDGEDARAGRWAHLTHQKLECGIHRTPTSG